ncbi:MAG: hypothetical protein M3144_11475 [Actinomycetota bacterium]|nr:hypothetical protein [Actinomycetota bacterium]
MLRRIGGVSNRALTYVGLGALAVILGLQIVIFSIWGDAGDPPDGFVAVAFVLFWGSVFAAFTVFLLLVRRRALSRRR